MYEMYPETWRLAGDQTSSGLPERPRRRARTVPEEVPAASRAAAVLTESVPGIAADLTRP